ncbi:MAG: two-component sensor histidine kinase [Nitrospira bacterium HGW-Nitrospira-1]|nr:MAG: two-component sensor histidine kinase [Nitrospira bacterium HGW-Nitrospira-1]
MRFDKNIIKEFFLRLSLNQKLVAMMLLLSLSIITVFVVLYSSAEQAIFKEFEDRSTELSKAIQIAVEEVTSTGTPDVRRLSNYLKKLNTKGVKEISVISNSDKIISSTNPKDVGKWLTTKKKELIFKAQLGETVTGEGHSYDVIIPIIVREKQYGYINLTINTEEFSSLMRERLLQRIIAALFVFGIGTIFILYLARRYTKPIEEVVRAARMVAGGNLDQELQTARKDEIGELTGSFNYMVRKLREERGLEEKLRKAEHLASVGQFSTSIAHEIRNPLNFISLSIDHMKEKYAPCNREGKEAFDSLIRNIKDEIQRVSRFAESFLEYGRPLEINTRPADIGKLISEVLELILAKAQKEHIIIERDFEPMPELSLDPDLIKTCLYNIILNAFQSMHEGGRLVIRTKIINTKCCIAVEDTGEGISEDKLARIFDPFFTTKAGGLGLGLALTKRVLEEHKGKVDIKSTEGRGTTVSLFLPVEKES